MSKDRNSNIELLRIIAMLLIIVYHIYFHCISEQLAYSDVFFNNPVFYKKLQILSLISPLGKISNAIFILISGYFLVDNCDIKILKISKKLLSQLVYTSAVLLIGASICFKLLNQRYLTLLDVNYINNCSWFLGYYFVIILIAKLFLNKYLKELNKEKYLSFCLIILLLSQFSWTSSLFEGLTSRLCRLISGIFLYSFGGYIKRIDPFEKIKSLSLIIILIICNALIILSNYNITMNNINVYYQTESTVFTQSIVDYLDNSFIVIVMAIALFELFRRIRIRTNKVINYIASSTLMIYLIHDNELFYSVWHRTNWISTLYYSPISFVVKLCIYTLGMFELGLIIYMSYSFIIKNKTRNVFKEGRKR